VRRLRRAICALLFLAAPLTAAQANERWITSWTAAPHAPTSLLEPARQPQSYQNRTVRQTLRLSAGGDAIRIRLSNAYGSVPLTVGGARIALVDASGQEIAGTSHVLTFSGATRAVVPVGSPMLSDPVKLKAPPLARVAVKLYFPEDTGVCSCHLFGFDDTEISAPGDFLTRAFKPEVVASNRAFLAGIEVDAPAGSGTVVAIGDSITDGVGSTPKSNRRWPDILAERLAKSGSTWGVANQGIGGNQVLATNVGESALARLDRDVFALPGVKVLILFEGINDIGFSSGKLPVAFSGARKARQVTAGEMIAGYRQVISRAHALGIKVYGATISPFKGSFYWTAEGENTRQEINRFIRTGGAFDAVLDFDAALADPGDKASIRAGLHSGDHLHGNDEAYRAIADSIDLRLLRR
jgi:lysophospholipase L1-like esterase